MLKSLDALEKRFWALSKRWKEECGEEIEKIHILTIEIQKHFWEAQKHK